MYKSIILPLAKLDIAEAASWYNSKQKGLGKRFTNEVRSKVLFIRENPKSSAVRYDDTRCAVLDIFPFMIHYTIDDANKTIIIAAIFHTSLNPERWKKR
jgi:plasmid stabilization system protein ParE